MASVLLTAVLFLQYRLNRQYRGLGLWAAGQAVLIFVFAPAAVHVSGPAGRVVAAVTASAIVGSLLFFYAGLMAFFDRTVPRRWPLVYAVVCLSAMVYLTFGVDDVRWRRLTVYLFASVVMVLITRALIRYRPPFVRQSARYVQILFAVGALYYAGLALTVVLEPRPETSIWMQSPAVILAFLGAGVMMTLWTFGIVFMIAEHLRYDLAEDRENLRQVFRATPDAVSICRLDDGLILDVNEGFTRLFGYSREEAVGRPTHELRLWAEPQEWTVMVDEVRRTGAEDDLHTEFIVKGGRRIDVSVAARALRLQGKPHLVVVTRDVTERLRLERELRRQALTDELTGVANRRAFVAALETSIGSAALVIMDLDGFKEINDTLGHAAGDALVRDFAARTGELLPDGGLVGRLGGDEFGVLLPDTTAEAASVWASGVLAQMPGVTFSAGVAVAGDTVDDLLAAADHALYRAKERGRNCVVCDDRFPANPAV